MEQINYQGTVIEYHLVRSRRKTIGIILRQGGIVEVRAPLPLSKKQIERVLGERAEWIRKNRQQMRMREQSRKDTVICSREYEALKALALKKIPERVNDYAKQMGEMYSGIRIKDQKTLWGSCSTRRNLNFNWRLVMAPEKVLDYVIVHELCHLKHMDHSPAFWHWVESVMPDYRKHRKWLKENGWQLSKVRPED